MNHFFAHVAGESFRSADGSDRQAIIPRCRVGDLLMLKPEPDNPHDINAIRVLRQNGEQMGYLQREFAGQVMSRSARGYGFHALVAGVGRESRRGLYGMALLIVVENDGASDDEVAAYGRWCTGSRVSGSSRCGRRTAADACDERRSTDRFVILIGIVTIGLAVTVALVLLR